MAHVAKLVAYWHPPRTGRRGNGVKIWEARSGRPVRELPAGPIARVEFSGHGNRLAISDVDVLRFLAVPSGQELRNMPGGLCMFSPESTLVAAETGEGSIRLVDPETGRVYARLEGPGQDRADSLAFSPDGSLLVTVGRDSRTIHAWDLRGIRD